MANAESIDSYLVLILGTSGMLLLTAAIAIFIYLYQRKLIKRKLEYQQIEDLLKKQELKSAYAMLTGQEKAYKHIAQELHDNLGSILVTLNMFADTLQKKTDPTALKELAKKISDVAQKANETTRMISHSLDSGTLKHFGLGTAIQDLTDAINDSQTLRVNTHVQLEGQLESEISVNVYRIIQELVNNTLKHAQAKKIDLEINQIKDNLSLIFQDDGIGFNPEEVALKTGLGLKSIESRIDQLEGTINIESRKNIGTTIIIDIPLP